MTENNYARKYNLIDKLDELKLKGIEHMIDIKFEILRDLKEDDYVKNYIVVQKIEEDYIKLIYNYVDMKRYYIVNKLGDKKPEDIKGVS